MDGFLDGECDVERDLAIMRRFLETSDCDDSFLEYLVILYIDGPTSPRELATPACGGGVHPSAFTLWCGTLWVQLYRRRVGVCHKRAQPRNKNPLKQ